MFQRILVPLDGSARAENAVPVAARLARVANGTVVLVEVANPHPEYGPYMDAPGLVPAAIEQEYNDAQEYLKTIAQRPDLASIGTETAVVSGPVGDAILAAAQAHKADLIIMMSHGRTGFSRWVLGSVAEHVTRHAPIPVLVLRDAGPRLMGPVSESGRPVAAVVPLDGSPLAEAAVQPAVELVAALAAPEQGTVHLLQVVEIPLPAREPGRYVRLDEQGVELREGAHDDARAYLDNVAQRLREALTPQHRVTITSSVAFDVDPAEGIIDSAEGHGDIQRPVLEPRFDVIVMATHGRGGLERWAMGSVTNSVLKGTQLPLLVVRPREIAAESQPTGTSTLPRTAPLR
jgi:nucleotide-binding universal stress UspA family protein